MHNPLSGLHCPDFRFRLQHRALSHRSLYLPLEMKYNSKIQRLLKGESLLSVFNACTIESARQAFDELRYYYDFAFWAAKKYYIRDREDADNIIPLVLNNFQHYFIDIIQKRFYNQQLGRYIITKSFGKVGVTTCIQAYILWMQTYRYYKHSYTCSASDISIHPLKSNLCRYLHRDIVPSEKMIFIPKAGRKAFFNTFRSPDYIRGIDLGYVHYADMSRWHDPDDNNASRAYSAATSAVLMSFDTLVILEGNIPKEEQFQMEKHQSFAIPYHIRLKLLEHLTNNPFFLDHVAMANTPNIFDSHLLHINLDHTYKDSKRIRILPLPPKAQPIFHS